MSEAEQGNTAPEPEGIDESSASQLDQANASAASAQEQQEDDAIYEAAMAELNGEPQPEPESEQAAGSDPVESEQPEPEQTASEPETEEAQPEPEAQEDSDAPRIDPKKEYIFPDENGQEHRIKGSDAAWLTQHMHRRLQEKDEQLQGYKPLEDRFAHDRGGLVRDIALNTDTAERLAAVGDILAQSGLTDMAQDLQQRMQQHGLQHDPSQNQQALMQKREQELEQERVSLQARQQLQNDLFALQGKLGRPPTAREQQGINNVFTNWLEARQANPQLQRPTMDQAYKMALEAIKFEDSSKGSSSPKPKPPTPAERVSKSGDKAGGVPSDDELFEAAMREQGIYV